eukprot:312579_1
MSSTEFNSQVNINSDINERLKSETKPIKSLQPHTEFSMGFPSSLFEFVSETQNENGLELITIQNDNEKIQLEIMKNHQVKWIISVDHINNEAFCIVKDQNRKIVLNTNDKHESELSYTLESPAELKLLNTQENYEKSNDELQFTDEEDVYSPKPKRTLQSLQPP